MEDDADIAVPGLHLVDHMTVEQKLPGGRKIDAASRKRLVDSP